ncbi:hypothetical protein [Diplocloster agilis]
MAIGQRIRLFRNRKEMAGILGVSNYALNVPDIDTYFGLIHTLFALEDMYWISPLPPPVLRFTICLSLGRHSPPNCKQEKSQRKNMTNGGISTQSTKPHIILQRSFRKV